MDQAQPNLTYELTTRHQRSVDFGVRVSIARASPPNGPQMLQFSISGQTLGRLGWQPGSGLTLGLYLGRDARAQILVGRLMELPGPEGGRFLRATRSGGTTGQLAYPVPFDVLAPRRLSHERRFRVTVPAEGRAAQLDVDLAGLFTLCHVQEPVIVLAPASREGM